MHKSLMPLRLIVAECRFAVFAVPKWLLVRDLDDFRPWPRTARCLTEQDVDFFERTAACFGLCEEVNWFVRKDMWDESLRRRNISSAR